MKITASGGTDIGRKRGHNEDAYGLFPDMGLFVVADGMGGHAAGEVASGLAVEVLAGFIGHTKDRSEITWPFGRDEKLTDAQNRVSAGIRLANRAVFERASSSAALKGMGTTIVAALWDGRELAVAHVGDSRAYYFFGGSLVRLTVDHSFVEEQVQAGIITPEAARTHPMRNVITRALGVKDDTAVDVTSLSPRPGEAVLLCTDGLTGMVDDAAMAEVILSHGAAPAPSVAALIARANESGGNDNITAVLIRAE